jgi:hypothetical protein
VFLKKPERIEVLGLVLLISLLIWRLIERSMRQLVEKGDRDLPPCVRIVVTSNAQGAAGVGATANDPAYNIYADDKVPGSNYRKVRF